MSAFDTPHYRRRSLVADVGDAAKADVGSRSGLEGAVVGERRAFLLPPRARANLLSSPGLLTMEWGDIIKDLVVITVSGIAANAAIWLFAGCDMRVCAPRRSRFNGEKSPHEPAVISAPSFCVQSPAEER